jgi:hypothetical protein
MKQPYSYSSVLHIACTLTIALGFSNIAAQSKKVVDSTYFISYPEKIVVKANVDTQTDTYILRERVTGERLEIMPNNQFRLFFSFDYKFVGFSFGFAPKLFADNDDNRLKGASSFTDYKFYFYFGKFVQSVQYQKINGYYVENTEDFIQDWEKGEDPYLQLTDFKKTFYGLSTAYVLNDRFSYRNLNNPTEFQRKSAGSFVPTLDYNFNRLSNKFLGEKSDEDQYNIRLALRYYYTLVLAEKWFVTPNISPSVGIQFSDYKSTDAFDVSTREKNTLFTRSLDGGMHLGFNTSRVFVGANLNFYVNWYDEDKNSSVQNDQIYGLLYVGYRFGAPSFIKRPIENAEDKMQEELKSFEKHKKRE